MTTIAPYQTSQTPPAQTGSSGAKPTEGMSERFLAVLVAQMKNQDPLAPMSNAEMTSQLAQLNQLDKLGSIETLLQGLAGGGSSFESALSALGSSAQAPLEAGKAYEGLSGVQVSWSGFEKGTRLAVSDAKSGRKIASLDVSDPGRLPEGVIPAGVAVKFSLEGPAGSGGSLSAEFKVDSVAKAASGVEISSPSGFSVPWSIVNKVAKNGA